MNGFQNAIEQRGYKVEARRAGRAGTPLERVLLQGQRMLNKLDSVKNVDELNSKSSGTYWWSAKAVKDSAGNDVRMVSLKYGAKVVPNTQVYVPNTIKDIRKAVTDWMAAAETVSDEDWAAEEQRRAADKEKNKK